MRRGATRGEEPFLCCGTPGAEGPPGWESGGREAPARLHGWLATARVEVEVGEDDPLAVFAGRRHGLLFSSVRLAVGGARLLVPRPAPIPLVEPS